MQSEVSCIAVGDPHFQVNNVQETEEFIKRLNIVVDKISPDFVVILGDLLHTHEKIHTIPFNLATKLLLSISKKTQLYLLIGNHDYCFAENTPIIMWDGSLKMSQDIKKNDYLIGADGLRVRVNNLIRGTTDNMYKITSYDLIDGCKQNKYHVTKNHTLVLKSVYKDISWENNLWIVKWLDENGNILMNTFSNKSNAQTFYNRLEKNNIINITVEKYINLPNEIKNYLYGFTNKNYIAWDTHETDKYQSYNIGYNLDYLPSIVNTNILTRLNIIAGIIDRYGYIKDNHSCFIEKKILSKEKIGFIIQLLRSVGICINNCSNYLVIMLCTSNYYIPNCKKMTELLSKHNFKPCIDDCNKYKIKIEKSKYTHYYGWELDRTPLFLLYDFTVVHNCNNQQFLTENHPFNSFKKIKNITVCDKVISAHIDEFKFVFTPYVPPERFEEALNTLEEDWTDAECIFAHQEFYGCRFNPVATSTQGDIWPEESPLVVSGHIHDEQWLQNNIYYTGSSMQHSFAENPQKTIALLKFKKGCKVNLKKIDLELPRKKIVYLNIDKIKRYNPDTSNCNIKLVLKGTPEEFKVFRKSEEYKKLIKQGISISFSIDKIDIPKNLNLLTKKQTVLEILDSLLEKESKLVHKILEEEIKN
jgi:DNA repair exonuclease SbcCD nuclease subunit